MKRKPSDEGPLSVQQSENLHVAGKQAGLRWASSEASYLQLKALHDWLELAPEGTLNPNEVARIIIGNNATEEAIGAFWKSIDDNWKNVAQTPEYLRGFVDGIEEVYEVVQDEQ